MMPEKHKSDSKHLENLINNAIKKVGARKENDICRYLPVSTGGYIHHFTMRKIKNENPEQLASLITKYIINVGKPQTVQPKSRAPRGSRKRRDQFVFTKADIDRLLNMARLADDKEMIRKLTPSQDLRTIKRRLIASIRHNEIDQDLWDSYVEVVTAHSTTQTGLTDNPTV